VEPANCITILKNISGFNPQKVLSSEETFVKMHEDLFNLNKITLNDNE
jgi:hypothetical protein